MVAGNGNLQGDELFGEMAVRAAARVRKHASIRPQLDVHLGQVLYPEDRLHAKIERDGRKRPATPAAHVAVAVEDPNDDEKVDQAVDTPRHFDPRKGAVREQYGVGEVASETAGTRTGIAKNKRAQMPVPDEEGKITINHKVEGENVTAKPRRDPLRRRGPRVDARPGKHLAVGMRVSREVVGVEKLYLRPTIVRHDYASRTALTPRVSQTPRPAGPRLPNQS